MITSPVPSNCFECPMARHLYADRFSCGNSLTKVVRGHFESIAECHDAVITRPDKFVVPAALPDFRGLDLEWIVNHLKLTLNWLDVYPDWVIPDGENVIEIKLDNLRIGYIKENDHLYYSNRLFGLKSLNHFEIALHMLNSNYLDGVVDEIITTRESMPTYM